MAKFKVGDKCRVVKNALAQQNVGQIVEIVAVIGNHFYETREDYRDANGNLWYRMKGYASEECLELVEEESKH